MKLSRNFIFSDYVLFMVCLINSILIYFSNHSMSIYWISIKNIHILTTSPTTTIRISKGKTGEKLPFDIGDWRVQQVHF